MRPIMSVLTETIEELREIEGALRDRPELARRVHRLAARLAAEDEQWLGVKEAQALLGVHLEETISAWVRLGLLRSRSEDGQIQVLRDDVLRQRERDRDLEGDRDDRPITSEEYGGLRSRRHGAHPIDRRAALEEVIAE